VSRAAGNQTPIVRTLAAASITGNHVCMPTADQLASFARDYWDLALLLATWLGILFIAVRRRRDWKRKRFTEQVNFSLNLIDADGRLLLRTLLESSARAVWLNEYGVKQVHNLCEHTTTVQPFLHMRNAKDMDYLKRAVLNEMSEQFAATYMAQALDVPHPHRIVHLRHHLGALRHPAHAETPRDDHPHRPAR
jgi:hypothetical protein